METEQLTSIEERLERIEKSIAQLTQGISQAPVMMSMATDSVDEWVSNAKSHGVNVDDRIKGGLQLLGRLSDPQMQKALNGMLDFVEQSPGLISMFADSVDESMREANRGSVRIDDRVKGVTHLLNKLSDPVMIEKMDGLIKLSDQVPGLVSMLVDSTDEIMKKGQVWLDPENLNVVHRAFEALSEAHEQEPAKVGGFFGTIKVFGDKDRQKALGFVMNVIKNYGKKMK